MPNVTCTISIIETDGDLSVTANIPDEAEGTMAKTMAEKLLGGATEILNKTFGVKKSPQRVTSN